MRTKGLLHPLVLAAILATGFLIVWGMIALWAVKMVGEDEGRTEKTLLFLPDGTPRLVHFDWRCGEQGYWDLEGNPVPPADDNGSMAACRPLPAALLDRTSQADNSWDQRIRSFTDGGSPAVYWYLVCDDHPDGKAYFVGYDSKSRTRVGFLGTAGFRSTALPSEEFIPFGYAVRGPGEGVLCTQNGLRTATFYPSEVGARASQGSVSSSDVYVVCRGGKIYHADLKKRTVHVALEEPRLCSAALVSGVTDPVKGTPFRPMARTDDALLMLDERGQLLKRYPIPMPLRSRDIEFAETTAGEAVMYSKSPFDALATEVEYHIYWVAADGQFRDAGVTLPLSSEMRQLRVLGAAVVPAPLVLDAMVAIFGPGTLLEGGRHWVTYGTAMDRILAEFWPALVIAQLLAAGLAWLCYRRQVRYRATSSERIVWPLFVLALGLPGWVGYRFGRRWPVLESCPECGVDVPRDREDCTDCEVAFPGPALKGTEVFA